MVKYDWSLCNEAVQNSVINILPRVGPLTVMMCYVGDESPDGAQVEGFQPGVQLYPKVSLSTSHRK